MKYTNEKVNKSDFKLKFKNVFLKITTFRKGNSKNVSKKNMMF